jgi:hypothetical protein
MSSPSNITIETIISSFPKSPSKVDGKPTYQTLKDLKDTLIEDSWVWLSLLLNTSQC